MSSGYLIGGGQFAGPTPTPVGSGINRALGLQGAALPGMAADPGLVQPVHVTGDTSDGLSRQLFTSRGWLGGQLNVGVGQTFHLAFNARVSAGVVIEWLQLAPVSGAGALATVRIGLTPGSPFAGGVAVQGLQVGGFGPPTQFTDSVVFASSQAFLGSGAFSFDARPLALGLPLTVYVRPGFWFGLEADAASAGVDTLWSMFWRELPE
jgi:hypothetical protein